jgi:elongation factor 1-gamma
MLTLSEEDQKFFSHLTKWYKEIASNETIVSVIGITRIGKVCQKGTKGEKIVPPKEEKKEKPKQSEEGEEERKPKKGPFDHLPPNSLDFDAFKRDIMNTTDKKGALDRLWAQMDVVKEGWSFWHLHYQKTASQGKVDYLTKNMADMFIQRIENFRKFAFATHGVYGENGNFEIKGMWMWRGLEHAPQMVEHDSYEFITFTKVDPATEEGRKLIEEYWLDISEGKIVEGLPIYDVIYFR